MIVVYFIYSCTYCCYSYLLWILWSFLPLFAGLSCCPIHTIKLTGCSIALPSFILICFPFLSQIISNYFQAHIYALKVWLLLIKTVMNLPSVKRNLQSEIFICHREKKIPEIILILLHLTLLQIINLFKWNVIVLWF